jgi:hypothetical protein
MLRKGQEREILIFNILVLSLKACVILRLRPIIRSFCYQTLENLRICSSQPYFSIRVPLSLSEVKLNSNESSSSCTLVICTMQKDGICCKAPVCHA